MLILERIFSLFLISTLGLAIWIAFMLWKAVNILWVAFVDIFITWRELIGDFLMSIKKIIIGDKKAQEGRIKSRKKLINKLTYFLQRGNK